jgi:predicted O-methyltransferase YrrM
LSLQQNPDEFTSLCLRLKESGPIGNYLEIGSASGGACLFLWKELGMARVVCLDDGRHPRAKEQDVNLAGIPNLKRHIGDSHAPEAGKFLEQSISGKLDVAFIDGDHTYDGVWQDIKLAMRFSRPGTLFILHDTVACRDVENAWLECVKEKLLAPLAEYIGEERPLGIAIGAVQ